MWNGHSKEILKLTFRVIAFCQSESKHHHQVVFMILSGIINDFEDWWETAAKLEPKKQPENWFSKTNLWTEKTSCQKGEKYSTSNSNAQSITILPTYLQFTMMLAVAVAGVPTPLLAMHWYWILPFTFLGLVTFTTLSSEVLDRKSELPTLVHFMPGFGWPDAVHVKLKFLPSTTVFTSGKTVTFGASDKR